jgi:hypothetical protein
MQQKKTFLLLLSVVPFFWLQILSVAFAAGFRLEDSKCIVLSAPDYELVKGKYDLCQETERWEKLTGTNSLLFLMDWRLVVNPRSGDQYMDKRITGAVKNNSEREFSEVKIEFTVFDEEGNQIGIVSSNYYDFKPRGIWKFEIPVTSDVGKAELKGLYIPAKDSKNFESNQKEEKLADLFFRFFGDDLRQPSFILSF